MRATRTFVLVLGLVLGAVAPLGAATFVQKCNAPPVSTQSGRINFTPGLNGRPAGQTLDVRVSLFECSPDRTSRGSGTFESSFTTKHARACGLLSERTDFRVKAKVVWKNDSISTMAITLTVFGRSRMVSVSGKVSAGQFAGHQVRAQYRFRPVASPYPAGLKQACTNKAAPNGRARKSVVVLDTYSTRPFVIT